MGTLVSLFRCPDRFRILLRYIPLCMLRILRCGLFLPVLFARFIRILRVFIRYVIFVWFFGILRIFIRCVIFVWFFGILRIFVRCVILLRYPVFCRDLILIRNIVFSRHLIIIRYQIIFRILRQRGIHDHSRSRRFFCCNNTRIFRSCCRRCFCRHNCLRLRHRSSIRLCRCDSLKLCCHSCLRLRHRSSIRLRRCDNLRLCRCSSFKLRRHSYIVFRRDDRVFRLLVFRRRSDRRNHRFRCVLCLRFRLDLRRHSGIRSSHIISIIYPPIRRFRRPLRLVDDWCYAVYHGAGIDRIRF